MRSRDKVNWRERRDFYDRTSGLFRHSKLALICSNIFPCKNVFSPEHWREKGLALVHRRKQGIVMVYRREEGPILILRRKERPVIVCNQARRGASWTRSTHLTLMRFFLWFDRQTWLQVLYHVISGHLVERSLGCWEAHHFAFFCLRSNISTFFGTLIR